MRAPSSSPSGVPGRRLRPSLRLVWGLAVATSLVALPALAGGFRLSPVRVTFTDKVSANRVTVYNDGASAVSIQTETALWRQRDGVDVLTPTDSLLVSPPIFTVPPGRSQVVRVASRLPLAPTRATEDTFRLFFAELPGAEAPQQESGLSLRLKLSIPVFVEASAKAKAEPVARLMAASPAPRLSLANEGGAHLQLLTLSLRERAGGKPIVELTRPLYLLAGNRRLLDLAPPGEALTLPEQELEVVLVTDSGTLTLPLLR